MLTFFDSYGIAPMFYINKKYKYQTKTGGILTIILFLVTLFMCFYFGEELVSRKSPSVNFSVDMDLHPEKLFYFDDFEFIFTLQNIDEQPYIDESIYFPRGYLLRTKVEEDGPHNSLIPINIIRCSEERPNTRLFDIYDLNNFYCISRKQDFNLNDLYIGEFWGHDKFQLLQVQILACNKGNDLTKCKNNETISQYLNQTKLSLYLLDTYVKTRDYKNPFEIGIKEYFYYTTHNSFLSLTQFLQTLKIESDDGLLFTSINKKKGFSLDRVQEYSLLDSRKSQFLNFNLQFSNVVSGYYRKYYKLQDFFSQIGGIFKLLMVSGSLLLYNFERNSYSEHLINQFFSFQTKDKMIYKRSFNIRNNTIKNKKFSTRVNTIQNNFVNEKIPSQTVFQNVSFQDVNDKDKSKQDKIEMKYYYKFFPPQFLIKFTRCSKKESFQLFKTALNIIQDYLNIVHLLKSLHYMKQIKKKFEEKESNFQESFYFQKDNPTHEINAIKGTAKEKSFEDISKGSLNDLVIK